MARSVLQPYSDADYAKINKELARQEQLRQAIEMAQTAGFQCDDESEACRQIREQLMKIKQVYFPHKP